jgi:hypothetical protein
LALVEHRVHGAQRKAPARADGPEAFELEDLAIALHAEDALRPASTMENWLLS